MWGRQTLVFEGEALVFEKWNAFCFRTERITVEPRDNRRR